ncbi:hypothetical protein Tco_1100428 [Tanacetum coccineum]
MPRPILLGYSEFRIVLHLTRRLSRILWKVQEGLGSLWKFPRSWSVRAMANKIEKIGASESGVVDENWGRDDACQNPKKKGTSKDVVANLDKRMTGVETSVAELKTQV